MYTLIADDGNYARMERCNFTMNSGLDGQNDLGAAIALTNFGIFFERDSVIRHDILDWYVPIIKILAI